MMYPSAPSTFDVALLLRRLGGSTELVERVRAQALVEIGNTVTFLAQARSRDDAVSMADVVHRLHGVLAELGAARAATLAAEVECAARCGDLEAAKQPLERLGKELSCLSADLSHYSS